MERTEGRHVGFFQGHEGVDLLISLEEFTRGRVHLEFEVFLKGLRSADLNFRRRRGVVRF